MDPSRIDPLDIARFWSAVDVGNSHHCWKWKGHIGTNGYGQVRLSEKVIPSHRAAYLIAYGAIDSGAIVRHRCDSPACCNPLHLETGTHSDNVRDRVIRNRTAKGVRNGRSKLTEADVRAIRRSGDEASLWASRLGVTVQQVNNIRRGRSWSHVS